METINFDEKNLRAIARLEASIDEMDDDAQRAGAAGVFFEFFEILDAREVLEQSRLYLADERRKLRRRLRDQERRQRAKDAQYYAECAAMATPEAWALAFAMKLFEGYSMSDKAKPPEEFERFKQGWHPAHAVGALKVGPEQWEQWPPLERPEGKEAVEPKEGLTFLPGGFFAYHRILEVRGPLCLVAQELGEDQLLMATETLRRGLYREEDGSIHLKI